MQHTGDTLGSLAELCASFSLMTSPEEVLGEAVKAARGVLGCDGAAIWMARPHSNRLDLGVVDGPHPIGPLMRFLVGQGLVGRAAARRQLEMVLGGQWDSADQGWVESGIQAAAVVPAIWHGQLVGVMGVWDDSPARQFSDRDVQSLTVLGRMFAAAYSSTLLDHTVVGQSRRLRDLHGAIRSILEEVDLVAGLHKVAAALRDLGWRQVILVLCDQDERVSETITMGEAPGQTIETCRDIIADGVWRDFRLDKLNAYRSDGVYFVPGEQPGDPLWHEGDLLFAPMRQGAVITGMVRMSDPLDKLRPTPEMLHLVDILVSQAAYIVENAHLLEQVSHAASRLAEQVDELSIIRRADREISSNLEMERVVRLALDWGIRRTAASAALVALVTEDGRGLTPFVTLGPVGQAVAEHDEQRPWPVDVGIIGKAVITRQVQLVRERPEGVDALLFPGETSLLAVPLAMRGEVLGVIALASGEVDAFGANDISFMERLGQRTAVSLDNARLYRRMKHMAEDMAALYAASRAISSTLEREEVLERIARTMAETLECSGAVIYALHAEQGDWQILAEYPVSEIAQDQWMGGTGRTPGPLMTLLHRASSERQPVVLNTTDAELNDTDREGLARSQIKTLLLLPLIAQDELIGIAMLTVSRRERRFSANDLAKAGALASQASVALRQSKLYNEVLELERIKTEMIRMASHDIRNPLNNAMGYLQLLARSLQKAGMTPEQKQYLDYLRNSTTMIKSLIEDLLTLERIESERGGAWQIFNFSALVTEVVDGAQPGAQLKRQHLTQAEVCGEQAVHGNVTQIRQAVANLISNAIKYTPENGQIQVTCHQDGSQVHFMVKDNGYGIARDRQQRVFERFYRARMPGTEGISGSGLGLSLVKTVIERHGGKVWFESEEGRGSTFGFWLPAATGPDVAEGDEAAGY